MNNLLFAIFFIVFAQFARATTIEAELAKPKAYSYESIDYKFKLIRLMNSENWCYKDSGVERCKTVIGQIISLNDTNFVINEKYRIDVKYDDLKKNKSCIQNNVTVAADAWDNRIEVVRRRVFCVEENNVISYTFKYFTDIKGIGLEKMYYATCSSKDLEEYKLPLLRKFNSFTQSQSPEMARDYFDIHSPLTGEHFRASLISTKDGAIKCQGDSALSIEITLNEYRQKYKSADGGWYRYHYTVDVYRSFIERLMEKNAKENKPKF